MREKRMVSELVQEGTLNLSALESRIVLDALGRMRKLVKKGSLPILETTRISASEGQLSLTVTDLKDAATFVLPYSHRQKFLACANLEELRKTLRSGKGFETTIAAKPDSNDITVSTNDGLSYHVSGLDESDFPSLPMIKEKEYWVSLDSDNCKFLLSALLSNDRDLRYTLRDAYVDAVVHKAISTDGHRMHIMPIDISSENTWTKPFQLSRFMIEMVGKMEGNIKVGVAIDDSCEKSICRMTVENATKSGRWVLLSQIEKSTYPDYTQILTDSSVMTFSVDAEKFNTVLQRLGKLSKEGIIIFHIPCGGSEIEMAFQTASNEGMEQRIVIEPNFIGRLSISRNKDDKLIDPDTGKFKHVLELPYKQKYLSDALQGAEDNVNFVISSFDLDGEKITSYSALKIERPDGFIALVMPMRI